MMPDKSWDVVVVGGGLIGSSAAYHLAQAGVRTLLVEQGDLASGASGGNFGLVQVQDAEFGLSLELTLESYDTFANLGDELDCDIGFQRASSLLLIENEHQLALVQERVSRLQAEGLDVQLLDRDDVRRVEPNLSPESIIGACYHDCEGELNPFHLVHAYATRGSQAGLEVWTHTEVTGIQVQSGQITGVETSRGPVATGAVVLATGAWACHLAKTVGVDLPLRWVHGEAYVTEQLPPIVHNSLSSAAFYEQTEESDKQEVGFCLRQRSEGNLLIGEAAFVTQELSRRTTATAYPAISQAALFRLPLLRQTTAIRGWAIPVAFVPDNRPLLGPVDGIEGLVVATGLKSTIILTPLVGRLVTDMVRGADMDPRLGEFSPTRSMAIDHA